VASTLSVRDIADRYGRTEATILCWIKSGELRAINVGRKPGAKKPRWRITPEALAAFELARESGTPAPVKTRRRQKRDGAVIQFY
jgi:transposase